MRELTNIEHRQQHDSMSRQGIANGLIIDYSALANLQSDASLGKLNTKSTYRAANNLFNWNGTALIPVGVQPYSSQSAFNASLTAGVAAVGLVNGVLFVSSDGVTSGPVVIGSQSVSAAKLKAAINFNKTIDYKTNFYNAPPAWVTGTQYYKFQAVASGGNWYVAMNSGVSGATAPTIQTPNTTSPFNCVSDGTVYWSYICPALTPIASDTTVAISFATTHNASCTQLFTPVTVSTVVIPGGSAISGQYTIQFSGALPTNMVVGYGISGSGVAGNSYITALDFGNNIITINSVFATSPVNQNYTITPITSTVAGSSNAPQSWQVSSNGSTNEYIASNLPNININPLAHSLVVAPTGLCTRPRQASGGGTTAAWHLFQSNGMIDKNNNDDVVGYWEISTDSLLIEIAASGNFMPNSSSATGLRVIIDDIDVNVGVACNSNAAGNGTQYTVITLTGPIRKRSIKVFGISGIYQANITQNASLMPVILPPLNILCIGDSFFKGSGTGPYREYLSYPQCTLSEMGLIGGGTLVAGPGTGVDTGWPVTAVNNLNWLAKLSWQGVGLSPTNPQVFSSANKSFDIVWVELPNGNDTVGSYPTLGADTLNFLQQLRALQPNALFLFHCVWPQMASTFDYNNYNATYPVIQNAITQFNDPNSIYIDAGQSKGQLYLQGIGACESGHQAGNGNGNLLRGATYPSADWLHPNDAGIPWAGKISSDLFNVTFGI